MPRSLAIALLILNTMSLSASEIIINPKKRANTSDDGTEKRHSSHTAVHVKDALELEPVIPTLATSSAWEPNVYSLVKYLLTVEHTATWPQNHRPVDPLKLQKLLYYAQGYALAVYGNPLFSGCHIESRQYGPLVQPVYELFKGKNDPILPADYESRFSHISTATLSLEQKKVIQVVLSLKSPWTGGQLIDATHSEEPYRLVQERQEITQRSLQRFFRKFDGWSEYAVKQLLLAQNSDEYVKALEYVRRYISFTLTEQEIVRFHEKLCDNRELIEKCTELGGSLTETRYCKWPHQATEFQGFMGHLFFPMQLELGSEVCAYLSTLPRIQKMLAFSAQHQNPLAQQLLSKALEIFTDDEGSTEYLPTAAEAQVAAACVDDGQARPYLYTALLCLARSEYNSYENFLKKSSDQGDPDGHYRFIGACCPENELSVAVEKLVGIHVGYGALLKAEVDKSLSLDQRVAYFEKAGEQGLMKGYVNAAELLVTVDSSESRKKAYQLFLKTARGHILTAYDSCASILIQDGDFDEAVELYIEKGDQGDPRGYCQAGELIKDKNFLKAHDLFSKNFYFGYSHIIRQSMSYAMIQDYANRYKEEKANSFNDLITIAGFQYEKEIPLKKIN